MIHESHFSYVVWALTPWAGDPSPRCRFQKQMEDWALHSERGGWRDGVLCSLSSSRSLLSFQFIFRLMSFFQYLFFFLSFSFTTSTCLCFLLIPSSSKQKKKRKKKEKKNVILFSELQLSAQQRGRKHAVASHFCNLCHAFLEERPVWSWGHLCQLTWLGCGGQREGERQGQGIQSGVLLRCCLLTQKADPTVFFLFLKAGLKLLYKKLGSLAWRHLAWPQRASLIYFTARMSPFSSFLALQHLLAHYRWALTPSAVPSSLSGFAFGSKAN